MVSKQSSVKETVFQACVDLTNANRVASRQAVSILTNLKLSVVDDHVKSLRDDGRLRNVVNGVVEPVEAFAASRPISRTDLPSGLTKIEVGDELLQLTPAEVRTLAKMLHGDAVAAAYIRGEREVYDTIARLGGDVKESRRRLNDLGRNVGKLQRDRRQEDLFTAPPEQPSPPLKEPHGTSKKARDPRAAHRAGQAAHGAGRARATVSAV